MENLSAGTSFPLYADDAKCARVINDFNDCYTLQNDLTKLYMTGVNYGNSQMNFNLQKCKTTLHNKKEKTYSQYLSCWHGKFP